MAHKRSKDLKSHTRSQWPGGQSLHFNKSRYSIKYRRVNQENYSFSPSWHVFRDGQEATAGECTLGCQIMDLSLEFGLKDRVMSDQSWRKKWWKTSYIPDSSAVASCKAKVFCCIEHGFCEIHSVQGLKQVGYGNPNQMPFVACSALSSHVWTCCRYP